MKLGKTNLTMKLGFIVLNVTLLDLKKLAIIMRSGQ